MLENPKTKNRTVLISILNWNAAEATLDCIDSLQMQNTDGFQVQLAVIDNGSRNNERSILEKGMAAKGIPFIQQETNLGFAGGHNISMKTAIDTDIDFVWLLNNDATVKHNTLSEMIELMERDPKCGAVAPISIADHDAKRIDFIGARHDWKNLTSIRSSSATETDLLEQTHSGDMWVAGTAVLFRTSALKEIGLLDEKLFAYFEDNDISARLSAAGWKNRVALDAKIVHACHEGKDTNRPPYFFYLMHRNFFRFWRKNTPPSYRRLLNVRLLDRSLYEVNKLYHDGFKQLGDAALLGVSDGFWGKSGPPHLDRRPSVIIVLLKSIFNIQHSRAIKRLQRQSELNIAPPV